MVFASLWFAVAGMVLPALWMLPFTHKRSDMVSLGLYGVLPPIAAAAAGALAGTPILRSPDTMSARRAIERGIGVGWLAVLIFTPLFALSYTIAKQMSLLYLPALVAIIGIGSAIVAGIPLTVIAGAAGWLLYRLAIRVDRTWT